MARFGEPETPKNMTDSTQQDRASRWRQGAFLSGALYAAAFALGLFLLLFAPALNMRRIFGLPLGLFGTTILLPLLCIAAIFWFAAHQRQADRADGITGR